MTTSKYQKMSTDQLLREQDYLSRMAAAAEETASNTSFDEVFDRSPDAGKQFHAELAAVKAELTARQ